MVRSITEILKNADQATTTTYLIDLWNEIAENKYQYPLCEIRFAAEHISGLVSETQGTEDSKNSFCKALEKMI